MAKSQFQNAYGDSSKYSSDIANSYKKWKAKLEEEHATNSLKTPEADKPGGGGVLGKLKSVIGGTGRFIKDAAVDVKDTTVDTWQGVGDVARGYRAEQDVKHNTEALTKRNKEWREKFGNATDEQWKDPKFQAAAKKFTEETKKIAAGVSANTKQDLKAQQEVDAKELAFKAGETVLNAAPLVGGLVAGVGKAAAKATAKSLVKTGGTEVVEQLLKATGKEAVVSGGKKLARNAAEGALFGAAYGATTTGKNDPDAGAMDLIKGAAIGGTVGGALPVVGAGIGKGFSKAKNAITKGGVEVAERVPRADIPSFTGTVDDITSTKTDELISLADKTPVAKDKVRVFQAVSKDGKSDWVFDNVDSLTEFKNNNSTVDDVFTFKDVPVDSLKPTKNGEHVFKLADDALSKADEIKNTGVKAKINEIFQPVKNLGRDTQEVFQKNAGGRNVAEVKSRVVQKNLQSAADEAGIKLDMNLAHQIEQGTAPDNAFTQQFRAIADKTRQEAVDAGLDIGYREDYVPHMWEQTPEAVDKLARGAGIKPQAGYKRVVPTYEEGIKLGLKPKYKDPAEMMGAYVKNLENTRTNVALLTDLKEQGLIKSGRPPAGWKTITAEGFPRTAQGNQLSAPKEVATVLNNIYGNPDTVMRGAVSKVARFTSRWMDIALAAGIPKTPANFFTAGQMMKEGSLGVGQVFSPRPVEGAKTIYNATAAFARSFSTKQTDKFFEANSGLATSMAKRGVKILPSDNGSQWDKLFNEPTFGRFMPNLQLGTAKNIQNALEKKLGKEAALDLTAETMKKMYGITDQLATGRDQAVQDFIGSIAFAPKYREGIINVLGNTIKAVADPRTYGDRSYALNRRLAVGLGATYMIYDQINKQTMGHGMNKNPEGKELTLAIPYGGKDDKGNQKVVYIPFMPSFLTIPRAAIGAAKGIVSGDMDAVASEGGKFLSMPIQAWSQLSSNKDYFGRPIVNDANNARATRTEEDNNLEKFKKRALYVAGQSTPAVVRAGFNAAQGKPLEQNLAQVIEAPVRFGSLSDKSNKNQSFSPGQVTGDFYDTYNPLNAKRVAASKEVTSLVKQGRINEAKRKAQEFNASLNGKFGKYYKKYGSNPSDDPMWDEMLNGLFIKTTESSFKARKKQ